jgi:hypothetical protein
MFPYHQKPAVLKSGISYKVRTSKEIGNPSGGTSNTVELSVATGIDSFTSSLN